MPERVPDPAGWNRIAELEQALKAARKRYLHLASKISQVRWMAERRDPQEGWGTRAVQDILTVLDSDEPSN